MVIYPVRRSILICKARRMTLKLFACMYLLGIEADFALDYSILGSRAQRLNTSQNNAKWGCLTSYKYPQWTRGLWKHYFKWLYAAQRFLGEEWAYRIVAFDWGETNLWIRIWYHQLDGRVRDRHQIESVCWPGKFEDCVFFARVMGSQAINWWDFLLIQIWRTVP